MKTSRNARVKIEIRIFSPVFWWFFPESGAIPCFAVKKFGTMWPWSLYPWMKRNWNVRVKKIEFILKIKKKIEKRQNFYRELHLWEVRKSSHKTIQCSKKNRCFLCTERVEATRLVMFTRWHWKSVQRRAPRREIPCSFPNKTVEKQAK